MTWCLLLLMKVSSVNRRESALLQQSCSILTEERLFPDSGYMLLLRIYKMLLSMNHRIVKTQDQWATDEGAASSRHTLHLLFSRPYLVRLTILSKVALMLQCCICRLSVCIRNELWLIDVS